MPRTANSNRRVLPACAGVLWAILAAVPARAEVLSLDDCMRIALEKNGRTTAASCRLAAAEQSRREAHAARLPSASLRGGATYAPLGGYDPALTEGGEYAGMLEMSQKLYDGGATRVRGRQADLGVQQASQDRARTTADLHLEVRLAYTDVVGAQRRATLLRDSIRDLESYLASVRSLAGGGAVPRRDVMKIEIQLQSESIALDDQDASLQASRIQLLGTMGLPPGESIAVADTVQLPALPDGLGLPLNPDLRQAELDVAAAELELRAARAERRPNLSLQGSLGAWTGRNQLLESDSPHVLGLDAGVALEMPVWNWGANAARVARQTALLDATHADYRVLQRQVDTDYRTQRAQYETARLKLVHLEENRQRALEQYRLVTAEYAGGGSTGLEVLDAHRSLLEIALQQQDARTQMQRLHAQLLRLAGEGL